MTDTTATPELGPIARAQLVWDLTGYGLTDAEVDRVIDEMIAQRAPINGQEINERAHAALDARDAAERRAAHIAWCKTRALAELDAGGEFAVADALTSMTSDLRKHASTAGDLDHGMTGVAPVGVEIAFLEALNGISGMGTAQAPEVVREWIESYR